jgi:TonB family protein
MMSAIANSLQKPEGFKLYVRKFRAICVMHGVPFGSRTDLPGFMQKLMQDQHLAMDFWNLIGKLSNREEGELSDDQVLTVVTESVAGGGISEEDTELKRTVANLRAMLAGVDIQSPDAVPVELAPFPPSEGDTRQGDRDVTTQAVVESAPEPSDSPADVLPETIDGGADQSAVSPATLPPQLDETLVRLEQTHLELKQHLDSIDKKVSNLGPRFDRAASMGTVANERMTRSADKPAAEEMQDLTHRPTSKSRLVLESTGSSVGDSSAVRKGYPPANIPLESYSQPGGYGKPVMLLLLVLVLAGAAFAGYRYRAPLQERVSALVQTIHQRTGSATSAIPTNQSAPPNAISAEEAHAPQPEQNQQPAVQPALESASTPPPANAGVSNTTDPVPSTRPHSGEGGSDSSNSRKPITDRVAAQAEQASADGISNADLAGAVRVAPPVMEANLIASRVPVYPETAKIKRVEGSVMMQAIISKDGTVKRVHVIEGDSRLRSAATEAVYKWRYRPYLLSGQPVDVATTITVDFSLDR